MADINVQPVQWPSVTLQAGRDLTFRLSYAAHYQLARWGRNIATATVLELAAACAGEFDSAGRWRSAGFERALDLVDLMDVSDELPVSTAVLDAIKKALPEADVSVQPIPAAEQVLV